MMLQNHCLYKVIVIKYNIWSMTVKNAKLLHQTCMRYLMSDLATKGNNPVAVIII